MSPRSGAGGQSTVELALCLPIVLLLALFLVQVALVVRAEILVTHAARAAARVASVDGDAQHVAQAARRSVPADVGQLTVHVERSGDPPTVTVDVADRVVTAVPLVGPLLGDVTVRAAVTMPVEPPDG